MTTGSLEAGFEYYDINLLVISSKELFNIDTKKRRKPHTAFSEGEKVVFADLKRTETILSIKPMELDNLLESIL